MNKELDFVKEMFDKIAHRYDFLNRLLSLRQDVVWRTQMVQAAAPARGSRILDVACGTCDVALEVSRHLRGRTRITGLDFSFAMLNAGRKKRFQNANQSISLVNGDALWLPFAPGTFDAIFIAFGIRNIMDRHRALSQFHTVLKKGGKLAVLELTTPQSTVFKKIYLAYFKKILPIIGALFSRHAHAYHYLPASVLYFPAPTAFAGLMSDAGFDHVRFKQMTFGIVTLFVGTRT
ncbi:MAG: bifunctional demethylmenaquinone methyltransferase/2-methoxy-6-polyprenyl-1,4-benzoquinol methylase UbiE [Desulfotignum sp.]|nr:bifunctional demethylmenaquinone methyltransferase/2-methoxy-6-polyprenyl-1,4-benzoquinol methylase UbiE [Desulfotignum sp.]MCF8114190.1 bifunctional demethylmenaquinone methyltransferase/2-methoxy-6-polyprenyl-1,4-benzoquinol methylase UbiE [Desulfotignum sp.]MCF8126791.1 bifunctional demethylmenaquinone methyltransferase/2-methoxy-6-polyprenyl-1,4-benzoquinol methylase UbiE [Desulfotignum sp.]